MLSFEDIWEMLQQSASNSESIAQRPDLADEGPDSKVVEFLRILDEYRTKCEDEGNYLEAGRAHRQLETLRGQEEQRRQKAVRARQLAERQDVQLAHGMQYTDFNAAWDRYMEEYDSMAQVYIQQMTEKHALNLLEFQLEHRPPRWSKELLEWRRRQHILARQKSYNEAQRIKKIADKLEDKERKETEQQQVPHYITYGVCVCVRVWCMRSWRFNVSCI
jgi:hypothetical protein